MSDGGRERASLGVEVLKSSQKWSVKRSAVRSIAWLDRRRGWEGGLAKRNGQQHRSREESGSCRDQRKTQCVVKRSKSVANEFAIPRWIVDVE